MTERVILKLGWPNERLNPNVNKGRAWYWSKPARDAAKTEAHYEAVNRGARNLTGDSFRLEITPILGPRMRGWDDDNLIAALKPHRDAIAKVMGVDDKCFRSVVMDPLRAKQAGVLIEVVVLTASIPIEGVVVDGKVLRHG